MMILIDKKDCGIVMIPQLSIDKSIIPHSFAHKNL